MDRRQRKTRKAVLAAFEELIGTKRYEDITVQDIIGQADIGRTTFYAHFETKDSVLDALCQDLFTHIFDEDLPAEKTHDFSGTGHSEDDMLTHILYHLREDKERYRKLFIGGSSDLFWSRFKILLQGRLEAQIQAGKWKPETGIPEDLYMELFMGSYIETIKWWFRNECREQPEQVIAYLEDFCHGRGVLRV